MKNIKMEDYEPYMGQLIDLSLKDEYIMKKNSINLSLTRILDNPSKYLDKDKTYFFYCPTGIQSKRAVQILSVYGYNVIRVI